jgi:hypothetical protein
VSQAVSGDEVRAAYQARVDWTARILDVLGQHGPLTTRGIYLEGLNGAMTYGACIATLARLLDDGRVVAARKPTTARGGRPGIVWSLA